MRRGTTPTIEVTVAHDLTDYGIHLALMQGGDLVVKTGDELEVEIVNGSTAIKATLTQEETLRLKSGKKVEVQVRAIRDGGAVAMATNIATIEVQRILQEGVLVE
jgi:hypothetical protein